jgi:glycosyltransferase involved in cell wall biosynthesis
VKTIWLMPPAAMQYASDHEPERGLLNCHLASVRLRVAVAAKEWKRAGHENIFWDPAATDSSELFDWISAGLCIVPKYFYNLPLQPWLAACEAAKRNGCPLVLDVTDYPFARRPPVPAFYSEALKTCDAVVVNSERMAGMIAPRAPRGAVLIEDAILGETGNPGFAPAERLELLWFGHPSNLDYLEARFEDLARFSRARRCRLTIVTEGGRAAEQWTREIPARFDYAFETQFIPWSLETMPVAFRSCDLVLIPSDPADPFKAGASANRIAEALNAGRFPVASPLRSYEQFADAAWLGEELVQGIEWALANPGEVLARIRRGQAMVLERFAAEAIGRRWRNLFEGLLN